VKAGGDRMAATSKGVPIIFPYREPADESHPT